MKICSHCKIEKSLVEFSPQKRCKFGVKPWCKECCRIKAFDARRKRGAQIRSHKFCPKGHDKDIVGRNKHGKCLECEKTKDWEKQLRKYNLTVSDYNILLKKQDAKCAICTKSQESIGQRLSVDHDHITGIVRGLLCNPCNIALGHFNDSLINLQKAVEYIRKPLTNR